jgi:hypothetical protein
MAGDGAARLCRETPPVPEVVAMCGTPGPAAVRGVRRIRLALASGDQGPADR